MRGYVTRLGMTGLLLGNGFMAAQDGGTIPSAVLAAADRGPLEFVMALANAAVPAGLEIHEPDDVLPANWPTLNGRPPVWFNADRTNRVSAVEVVDAFNRSHRDYRASLVGQVLVVRPHDGRLSFLDRPSPVPAPTHITGAMAAARRVFTALVPGLAGPVLGSGIGQKGDEISVVLDAGGRVIDDLNQIARQAPPRAWVVTTRQRGEDVHLVRFGFIEADGSRVSQGVSAR